MGLLCRGLMGSSPKRPGNDLRLGEAPLCEPVCDAADFLNRPADKRRVTQIWGIVCLFGIVLARWRIAAIMATRA
jgi:hypothetical protein